MYNYYAAKEGNAWASGLFTSDVMQIWRGREKNIIENITKHSRFLNREGCITFTRPRKSFKVYCAKIKKVPNTI